MIAIKIVDRIEDDDMVRLGHIDMKSITRVYAKKVISENADVIDSYAIPGTDHSVKCTYDHGRGREKYFFC